MLNQPHRRKPPNRNTVPVTTSIRPEMLDQAKADAERSGYKTLRAYLEALIDQGLLPVEDDLIDESPDAQTKSLAAAYPSSAWALGPAILMNRSVMALEALTERIRAGEEVEPLRADLMSLRWEIGQHLLRLREDYDREVQVRDLRHYGRLGGVE
jgi:hypothetical protein